MPNTVKDSHDTSSCYSIYHAVWTIHRVYETLGGGNQTMGWKFHQQLIIIGLSVTALGLQSVRLWMLAILAVLVADYNMMPFIWDSEYWCICTDVTLLLAVLAAIGWKKVFCFVANDDEGGVHLTNQEKDEAIALAGEAICVQMKIFYSAAMFWKLTWDFLDPHSSCAPIFVMQLLDAFLPAHISLPVSVAQGLTKVSPISTLLLEGYVAVALWRQPSRGVMAALVLHSGIAACPPPENVATFSLMCASRLILFVPAGCKAALQGQSWSNMELISWPIVVALTAKFASHEGFYDYAYPLFTIALPFVWKSALRNNQQPCNKPSQNIPWVRWLAAVIAFAYAYLLIPLGLMDQGQPHMYANLRLHGGSNHILGIPTSLLQQWLENDVTSAFGGGIVRIESSTSKVLNAIYPSDYTEQMTERSRRFLINGGHTSRNFNAMLTVCTSSEAPWKESKGPFVRYTIPAHEFRRVLEFVRREETERYKLEFTVLKGHGDERWRAQGDGRRFRIDEAPNGKSTCQVIGETKVDQECKELDLPNLPPLPWWATKFMLFEPYPILENDYRLHCFGP